MNKEVLDLIFEFLISVLVIVGGGILILLGKGDSSFITSMMALVIYFWFQSRSNTATVNNLLKQFPVAPVTLTDGNPAPAVPLATPASVVTNPTNPPVVPSGGNI